MTRKRNTQDTLASFCLLVYLVIYFNESHKIVNKAQTRSLGQQPSTSGENEYRLVLNLSSFSLEEAILSSCGAFNCLDEAL